MSRRANRITVRYLRCVGGAGLWINEHNPVPIHGREFETQLDELITSDEVVVTRCDMVVVSGPKVDAFLREFFPEKI